MITYFYICIWSFMVSISECIYNDHRVFLFLINIIYIFCILQNTKYLVSFYFLLWRVSTLFVLSPTVFCLAVADNLSWLLPFYCPVKGFIIWNQTIFSWICTHLRCIIRSCSEKTWWILNQTAPFEISWFCKSQPVGKPKWLFADTTSLNLNAVSQ